MKVEIVCSVRNRYHLQSLREICESNYTQKPDGSYISRMPFETKCEAAAYLRERAYGVWIEETELVAMLTEIEEKDRLTIKQAVAYIKPIKKNLNP